VFVVHMAETRNLHTTALHLLRWPTFL
jgi:hypothetical protein